MRLISLILLILISVFGLNAQVLKGTVKNEAGEALPGAVIKFQDSYVHAVTGNDGEFRIQKMPEGNYIIKISLIGFEVLEEEIQISKNSINKDFILKISDIVTDEVVITALRADDNTPVAYTNIERSEINEKSSGRDIPYLLDMTPSMVVTSDAGAGIGYTSMRIRGTDITRINVTLDGIPLNDAESHSVYWVNMPDFASSVDNIQVQRGVGTSTNGAAAFGANVNFVTNKIEKDAYAELDFMAGSFNTFKGSVKAGSGLINNRFAFDGRYSYLSSDGYVDRAYSDLRSYYLSGAYTDQKNFFKINVFRGTEKTYQAWMGVPKVRLENDTEGMQRYEDHWLYTPKQTQEMINSDSRTYNYYTYDNETDNYTQDHLQLFYSKVFSRTLDLNVAFHYTGGEGYYEQEKLDEDLSDYNISGVDPVLDSISSTNIVRRKWLDNDFYGGIFSLKYRKRDFSIIFGGAWNTYSGEHFGKIIYAADALQTDIDHEWYRNSGQKNDMNEYVKVNWLLFNKLNLWADVQYRSIRYEIDGIHDDLRDITQTHSYNFVNPKGGFTFHLTDNNSVYFSFAAANREPSRSNFRDADENEQITYETLYDYEGGFKLAFNKFASDLNLFIMDYKNQLILTGEINNVGDAIMTNVPDSYRAGIELSTGLKLTDFLDWNINIALSKNKIKNLTIYTDNWDTWGQDSVTREETDISFSPGIVAGSELSLRIIKGLAVNFMSKYVGKQYIDNTSNDERSLDPYFVNNLRVNYTFHTKFIKDIGLSAFVNNIFNEEYETNAWVYRYSYGGEYYTMDGYFPQAGINFMFGVNLKF